MLSLKLYALENVGIFISQFLEQHVHVPGKQVPYVPSSFYFSEEEKNSFKIINLLVLGRAHPHNQVRGTKNLLP